MPGKIWETIYDIAHHLEKPISIKTMIRFPSLGEPSRDYAMKLFEEKQVLRLVNRKFTNLILCTLFLHAHKKKQLVG
jgi:hypothetical protein